jgi:uncharacterized protein (TIGR00730 family)
MTTQTRLVHRRRSRPNELKLLGRSLWDFVKGIRGLRISGPLVTVFGSARVGERDPAYAAARELGQALGRAGFAVMTGGGPGLMEAVNRGAREVGTPSFGCRIALPFEQRANVYLDCDVTFRYFFARKVMMCRYSAGFVVLPGGFGTLDELFEILALMQTRRMTRAPVILFDSNYWQPLREMVRHMVGAKTVAARDQQLFQIADDIPAVLRGLRSSSDAALAASELPRVDAAAAGVDSPPSGRAAIVSAHPRHGCADA